MQRCIFDSRNPVFRDPCGAVEAGQPVHLKLCLPRSLGCSQAILRIRRDEWMDPQSDGMFWCGMEGDGYEWWECHFTPPLPGLYWYSFECRTPQGLVPLEKTFGSSAGALCHGGVWQMTVYEAGFETPGWLRGGVMYQIFPDRFARSGEPKAGVPAGRTLREDWGALPKYRPNEQGKITNSDFFGGDLKGIEQKLPYLQSLGVTCLYLNPIFESHSNHRYDTADYSKVDPLLGSEKDLKSLCSRAAELGIHILLDGVFSHTGSDSVYFNREGRYPGPGAFQSQDSPYFSWYQFQHWPDRYSSWWGFETLPEVHETSPAFLDYLMGDHGVIRKWLRCGISGWRLDVADELPDQFLEQLRSCIKEENREHLILGEVWEDASNKESYGHRRRFLLGRQLDSVMNYPFRSAILNFLRGGTAEAFLEAVLTVVENYPPQVLALLMNHIGTHDTERALTMLGGEPLNGRDREWQAHRILSPGERARGIALLRLAAILQYTLPGVPCLYYGDEAGMEGYRDPFNRGCYPWGQEDSSLIGWYRSLGRMRRSQDVLKNGRFVPQKGPDGTLCFARQDASGVLLTAVNRTETPCTFPLAEAYCHLVPLAGDGIVKDGRLTLPALGGAVLGYPQQP